MTVRNHLIIACLLSVLLGCTMESESEPAPDPELQRLVELADAALAKIDGDSRDESKSATHVAWVLAATEVSLARNAMGDRTGAAALLEQAATRAAVIGEPAGSGNALALVASAMIDIDFQSSAETALQQARSAANAIEDETKRWDLLGKLAALDAKAGRVEAALDVANDMPQSDETLAAYKARTLHDIAPAQAAQGALDAASATTAMITMGLPYYHAAAASDVAIEAHTQARPEMADALLNEAESIGRSQTDGYFIAGSLRHAAVAYASMSNAKQADRLFADALQASILGESPQHRARAISRVATSMADVGKFDAAAAALPQAVELARGEDREPFRLFSFYEIAGSAAFAGDFATAKMLLDEIPADFAFGGNSIRAAAQRDVAWGLARHQRLAEAIEMATDIDSPRERSQALSRILQVAKKPDMIALPRYL